MAGLPQDKIDGMFRMKRFYLAKRYFLLNRSKNRL